MQIVIDIPDVFYKYCKAQKDATEIQLAVKNGIPLPKEHGDLIDISKLPVTYTYLGISDKPTEVVNYNCILNAKKIIKADKAERRGIDYGIH